MEYTKQQNEALDAIKHFIDSDDSIFVLKGYAGTGKTTLIKPIIEIAKNCGKSCQLMAPTGRAAKIIKDKTGVLATTIHGGIYALRNIEIVEGDEENDSSVKYKFPLRSQIQQYGEIVPPDKSILIIDESSMISSRKTNKELLSFGSGILLNDIIRYSKLQEGGKIIFIGDPAQLPPVEEIESVALNETLLARKNQKVSYYELTDIIRQESESTILKNSIKLRNVISSGINSSLILERKPGEVEDIQIDEIVQKYCSIAPVPALDSPVVICFSNMSASEYNNSIRQHYFHSGYNHINKGDKIIVVGNNYSIKQRHFLNGEFAQVVDYSDNIEIQTGFVYRDFSYGKKRAYEKTLAFRDVTLQFEDEEPIKVKIFDSLLTSSDSNLSYEEQCALMSNFSLRHKDLKPQSRQYTEALLEDPYYNAVRAKYGYAITCHKAQGGEWNTVFVDFSGRTGFQQSALRWSYTAITRARKMLYGYHLHCIPVMDAFVKDIKEIRNLPSDFFPASQDATTEEIPFYDKKDPESFKVKYSHVKRMLNGTPYKVFAIEHKPYREIYIIIDDKGHSFRFDCTYNKYVQLKPFVSVSQDILSQKILSIINTSESFNFSYTPSNRYFADLYQKVKNICSAIEGVSIINIAEYIKNYKVVYYLRTDDYSFLEIWINKYGIVTCISPSSLKGMNDKKLCNIIESLKNDSNRTAK